MTTLSKVLVVLVIILIIVVAVLNIYLNNNLEPAVRQCIMYTDYSREDCDLYQG